MRFKLDENLPWSISNIIIDYGYDVETVLSEGLDGFDKHLTEKPKMSDNSSKESAL